MLEYLEDIIGTSKYKEHVEEAMVDRAAAGGSWGQTEQTTDRREGEECVGG